MDCSMSGFSVHHQLPELAQTQYPSCQWCHPAISSSVIPFFYLQSFPVSGSFPINQFFASGGQSIGASASASVFPTNIQGWFRCFKKCWKYFPTKLDKGASWLTWWGRESWAHNEEDKTKERDAVAAARCVCPASWRPERGRSLAVSGRGRQTCFPAPDPMSLCCVSAQGLPVSGVLFCVCWLCRTACGILVPNQGLNLVLLDQGSPSSSGWKGLGSQLTSMVSCTCISLDSAVPLFFFFFLKGRVEGEKC